MAVPCCLSALDSPSVIEEEEEEEESPWSLVRDALAWRQARAQSSRKPRELRALVRTARRSGRKERDVFVNRKKKRTLGAPSGEMRYGAHTGGPEDVVVVEDRLEAWLSSARMSSAKALPIGGTTSFEALDAEGRLSGATVVTEFVVAMAGEEERERGEGLHRRRHPLVPLVPLRLVARGRLQADPALPPLLRRQPPSHDDDDDDDAVVITDQELLLEKESMRRAARRLRRSNSRSSRVVPRFITQTMRPALYARRDEAGAYRLFGGRRSRTEYDSEHGCLVATEIIDRRVRAITGEASCCVVSVLAVGFGGRAFAPGRRHLAIRVYVPRLARDARELRVTPEAMARLCPNDLLAAGRRRELIDCLVKRLEFVVDHTHDEVPQLRLSQVELEHPMAARQAKRAQARAAEARAREDRAKREAERPRRYRGCLAAFALTLNQSERLVFRVARVAGDLDDDNVLLRVVATRFPSLRQHTLVVSRSELARLAGQQASKPVVLGRRVLRSWLAAVARLVNSTRLEAIATRRCRGGGGLDESAAVVREGEQEQQWWRLLDALQIGSRLAPAKPELVPCSDKSSTAAAITDKDEPIRPLLRKSRHFVCAVREASRGKVIAGGVARLADSSRVIYEVVRRVGDHAPADGSETREDLYDLDLYCTTGGALGEPGASSSGRLTLTLHALDVDRLLPGSIPWDPPPGHDDHPSSLVSHDDDDAAAPAAPSTPHRGDLADEQQRRQRHLEHQSHASRARTAERWSLAARQVLRLLTRVGDSAAGSPHEDEQRDGASRLDDDDDDDKLLRGKERSMPPAIASSPGPVPVGRVQLETLLYQTSRRVRSATAEVGQVCLLASKSPGRRDEAPRRYVACHVRFYQVADSLAVVVEEVGLCRRFEVEEWSASERRDLCLEFYRKPLSERALQLAVLLDDLVVTSPSKALFDFPGQGTRDAADSDDVLKTMDDRVSARWGPRRPLK